MRALLLIALFAPLVALACSDDTVPVADAAGESIERDVGPADVVPRDTLPADTTSVDLPPPCIPAGITKLPCPGAGNKPCPQGSVCRDQSSCAGPGCVATPACTVKQGAFFFRASPTAGSSFPQQTTFIGKASVTGGDAGPPVLSITDPASGGAFTITSTLPSGIALPLTDGMDITVKACGQGNPINTAWVLVVRELSTNKLLFAGGWGGRALSATSCWNSVIVVQRVALGCEARLDQIDPVTPGYVENFAVRLYGDAGAKITVDLAGPVASVTKGGKLLHAVLTDARHVLEWPGTDVSPPFEGLVLVPE